MKKEPKNNVKTCVATYDKVKAEKANTWTHIISLLLFAVMSVFLLWKGCLNHSKLLTFSLILFVVAEVMMFTSSSLYHYAKDHGTKRRLRYFDHCAIYVSIAGSYSPILLWTIGGTLGYVCFAVIWSLALIGSIYKICALGKHPRLSLILYIAMGWLVVFIAKPVIIAFPAISLWFLLSGGIAFTLGTYFFWKDDRHTYYHAIWHIAIFLGCVCHLLVLWFLV